MLEVPQLNQIGKDLLAAVDLLLTRGWCQRHSRINGRVCAGRAICEVIDGNGRAYSELNDIIIQYLNKDGHSWENIPAWNDAPDRTLNEILAVFREIAYNQRIGE